MCSAETWGWRTNSDAGKRPCQIKRTPFADSLYTASDAGRRLQPRKRTPFGVTNGEACSQRATDDIIADNNLSDTFAHVDSLMVCGGTQNLAKFLIVAEKYNSTLNCGKCAFSAKTIDLQGYTIADETFGYDAKRTPDYSEKIHSLEHSRDFPLGDAAVKVFAGLDKDIGNSVVLTIDNALPLGEEADASVYAIVAALNQSGGGQRHSSEGKETYAQRHSSEGRETYASMEVSRKWQLYLLGKHSTIIAGQNSVALMFQEKDNPAADTVSRTRCAAASRLRYDLHVTLCRPGATRCPPSSAHDISRTLLTR